MKVQYKCMQCGRKFDAENNTMVVCPQCASDNIQPISKNNVIKYVLMGGLFLAMSLVGFFVTKSISSEGTDVVIDSPEVEIVESDTETEIIEEPVDSLNVSLSLKITNLKYIKGAYSFTAKCLNALDGEKIKWTLRSPFGDHAIIATSNDGKFNGVPASEDGTYVLCAESETAKGEITISGFEKVYGIPKGQEMTAAELEQKINQQDKSLLAANPKVSTNPVLRFVGIAEDDIRPDNIQKIFNKIKLGTWERVKVVGVQYNESNCISSITITPIYPEE